jgi:hypothetical protein
MPRSAPEHLKARLGGGPPQAAELVRGGQAISRGSRSSPGDMRMPLSLTVTLGERASSHVDASHSARATDSRPAYRAAAHRTARVHQHDLRRVCRGQRAETGVGSGRPRSADAAARRSLSHIRRWTDQQQPEHPPQQHEPDPPIAGDAHARPDPGSSAAQPIACALHGRRAVAERTAEAARAWLDTLERALRGTGVGSAPPWRQCSCLECRDTTAAELPPRRVGSPAASTSP